MIGNNLFHTIIVDVDSTSPIGVGIIDPTGKINRIHHMVHINGVSPAETIIIINVDFPRFSFFSRYQHYAEWRTGTIDGRGSRILQHRNRFNVRNIYFFHLTIRLFYPINYKQWFFLPIFQRKSFLTYPQWIFLKNSVCLQLQMTCFI